MNRKGKGDRIELKAKKELESLGYLVEKPVRTRWNTNKDFFNLFDLIALSKDGIKLIQVKSNYCPKKVRDAIRAFHIPESISKEVWVWKDYKGWRIERL